MNKRQRKKRAKKNIRKRIEILIDPKQFNKNDFQVNVDKVRREILSSFAVPAYLIANETEREFKDRILSSVKGAN